MQDVGRNGNLRHRDPTLPILLDNKALRKVNLYREDYRRPGRSDRAKAFLPAVMSTSGRIQGELLRLLFTIGLACAQAIAARVYLPSIQHQRRPPPPPPQGTLDNLP